ncbi:INO80 chromatin remodeling complex Ies1-like protein [Parathielavia hyrcaniae]|uniref:INO80 chromatin remodeling complex Ies1-like protein n=1 Tax=Parathielavia hyrcaniae TaxID=113614 RepID=A0AAN6QAP7_9PEZI|nr:INO80 chromatin remodeling complex Ies1-like protein [Parathielavia hyrcaniae]
MAATPNSPALMSDIEPPSSPFHMEKSFMTAVTEDDDTRMMATPEPSERQSRGKKRGRDDGGGTNGNPVGKIRHLKKDDGDPLWRKDIQFDFLRAVFDNDRMVFTNSYEKDRLGKQCFADLYIDTMSRSSKTSKVLRDKLLSDREAAKGMAMVCLLVNIGRMNTTLNFFPEMRAQLRTYHAIPCLQARQDPHAYKQLQDAPRLKSILKGGSDDRPEPTALDEVKNLDVPRTNPVNLLFLICQSAAKVAELHFPPAHEFHDLIMKTNFSSESRANAFLWLMWFYLESDFTEEGCEENPFGPGVDYGVDVANQGVPRLQMLTEEEEEQENVDTQEEIDFGFLKQKMRAKIIEADQQFMAETQTKKGNRGRSFPAGDEVGPTTGILPRIRPSKHDSDLDSVRSTPPPRALGRQGSLFGSMARRGPHSLKYQVFDGSSPGPDRAVEGVVARKPRPPTAHQIAVERNRTQRVEYILDRGLRRSHHSSRKLRRGEGSIVRALPRLAHMQDPFDDSDEDEVVAHGKHASATIGDNNKRMRERGYGGLAQLKDEPDDFGEQLSAYAAAFRRVARRLERWESYHGPEPLGVIRPIKRPKANGGARHADEDLEDGDLDGERSPSKDLVDPAETEDETDAMMMHHRVRRADSSSGHQLGGRGQTNGVHRGIDINGDTVMDDADELDEVDKELLGLGGDDADDGEGDGDGDGEEELDDVDKTLLGMDGDSDSD